MHRTWAERWVEQQLRERRREELAQRRRKARAKREAERRQAYAPGPHKRAVSGELVEDALGALATVWRKDR